ncbi:MAG: hypothetical protein Q9202_006814 [Teloschistes flavicans]
MASPQPGSTSSEDAFTTPVPKIVYAISKSGSMLLKEPRILANNPLQFYLCQPPETLHTWYAHSQIMFKFSKLLWRQDRKLSEFRMATEDQETEAVLACQFEMQKLANRTYRWGWDLSSFEDAPFFSAVG